MPETRSTCPYCGVGCGLIIRAEADRIVDVRGDPEHPANFGRLCTKGSTLHLSAATTVNLQTRLLRPMRRRARGGPATAVSWDEAAELAAERLAGTWQCHGPDAIGVYASGQLLTEDYHVFNKLVKGLIGTNHIDTNSRLCMSSAVAGYKATLGADAPPCSYEDVDHARTVFISGSNMAWAHPVLFRRLEEARRAHPEQKWIVADPRRTETASVADLHLPLSPGSDVALCHGLLHLILWEGLADTAYIAAHTQGFEALRDRVREATPRETARRTGLKEADLVQAARWFGGHTPTLSLYCQGLNQSTQGTANNAALINLHLATGQIGRPGAGPFSLTGQPNAMGGREVGGMANLLPGHRDLADPAHRAEVARLWGVPSLPATPGRTAVEMFEAAADGEVKLLWIACTNPAQSLPNQAMVRRALERAEFVIVQEAFHTTATVPYADLLLPATTWGEKDGTVTNSERRISRVRPAVTPPGEARHDWVIASDIARRLARRIAPERVGLFAHPNPASVWNEHRESTRGRDLDVTGLSYELLERLGPQQWPMPEGASAGRPRLYEDGRFATEDGRARFHDAAPADLAEARSAAWPFSLITGRLRDHWHGLSRTGNLGRLYGHERAPVLEMHPQDLARLRLAEGDLARVRSRRGELVLPVRAEPGLQPTQAFVAMHWGEEVLTGQDAQGRALTGVNGLTLPARCATSQQPELKHAAVKIERAELPWRLSAMAWLPADQALAIRELLRPWLSTLAMGSVVPFGREPDEAGRLGLWLRGAAAQAPADPGLVHALREALGLRPGEVLAYEDPQRGHQRAVRTTPDGQGGVRLQAFWLSGDASGETWLRGLLESGESWAGPARQLLVPGALAGRQAAPRSPQVCNCFNVSEASIVETLAACEGGPEQRLAQLQGRLKCGTQCGSCLPAIRSRYLSSPPRPSH